jgi:hexosaminidase
MRRSPLDAMSPGNVQPGLTYMLFDGKFESVRGIEQGTRAATGISSSFELQQFARPVNYGIRFDGCIEVESDGFYRFDVESDDGSLLQIDDEVVVDNDGNHAPRLLTGHIPLRQGLHKVKVLYFQSEGGLALRVNWGLAGADLQPLQGAALCHW